jgi:phasin
MDTSPKTTATKAAGSPMTDGSQAFREMAEKSTAQVKEAYEKLSATTTEATDLIKNSYSTAINGARDYNKKVIEFLHTNANVAFDFAQKLSAVRSSSEFVELSTEHARKQFETLTEQTKELAALAQKVALATTNRRIGEGNQGTVEQVVGKAGDAKLESEGTADKIEGKLQNAVGGLKEALKGK